jgi:hypothetical protein
MEVIYLDGSHSTFRDGGGAFHGKGIAIERLRLITARSALRMYVASGGEFQLTRNGAQLAIKNVVEPLTGKTYKRSMAGKSEALADVEQILAMIESQTVIWEEES